MAKNTYQTYTEETPFDTYREDFIRRGAMCGALAKRYPGLAAVGAEANVIVAQIDARRTSLQAAEDDQIRARAVEDAEKLDVVDIYTELRRTIAVKSPEDALTLLPEAPSALRRLGAATFTDRTNAALSNLRTLAVDDPLRVAFLDKLEKELAEFSTADKNEDKTRLALQSGKVALTLYKSELSQVREAELGTIQSLLKDREKTALFTIPWRKTSRAGAAASEAPAPEATP
ncbi:hypothetical protein [Polyangium mundeleinium]|uniref:Uncharacterized protein n=1 Tax=Polyangium mundeleinium TaxID=2995306 RepID=A0ABT5F5I8_9BACT|nr:hypothetical protein [Polyangium mundeleinium]MDC0748884.1 hypothetical protein [Polyangium mundeleinium]